MANEASPSKTNIWYELNGRADIMEDFDVSKTVAQLRNAIIAKNPPLQSFSPGTIDIYKPGTSVPVADGTECINPRCKIADLGLNESDTLIVVPPPPLQQHPRSLGHLQQQEQQDSLFSADLKRKLDEMYQVVVEDRTEKKSYTDASMAFCNDLLGGLSIRYQENSLNQEDVDGAPLEALPWTQTLTDGTAVNLSEPARTQAALDWLKANMTPGFKVANQPIALKDVKGKQFQPLRAAKKEANGKTDGVVGIQAEIQACENTTEWYFTYSMGLVEIKTDRRRLKKPQMFFQLVALSRESRWGQAVVLLGTDCNKSWFLMWFQEHNKICLQQYLHGRTCLQNFEMLLANIHQRQEDLEESCRKLGRVSSLAIQEEQGEHDLSGFPVNGGSGTDQDKVDQALENEAFLHRVANDLAELYGERPALPEWALAKNKIPSYYA